MKRYLILTMSAVLLSPISAEGFGKYGSKYEAFNACRKWIKEGRTYKVEHKLDPGEHYYDPNNPTKLKAWTYPLRNCRNEDSTNQTLGLVITNIKSGAYYKYKLGKKPPREKYKVVKRFKY